VCLACTRRQHNEGDRGITRKYRNPEAPQSTQKGFCCYIKAVLIRRQHRNNAPTTTAAGRCHTGALNNLKKNEDLQKASDI